MQLGTIDHSSSYFKFKTPTPIRGSPAHKLIKRLKKELQVNTSPIQTYLGGGNHGFLGLALTDEEHASMSNTQPFISLTCTNPQIKEEHASMNAYLE